MFQLLILVCCLLKKHRLTEKDAHSDCDGKSLRASRLVSVWRRCFHETRYPKRLGRQQTARIDILQARRVRIWSAFQPLKCPGPACTWLSSPEGLCFPDTAVPNARIQATRMRRFLSGPLQPSSQIPIPFTDLSTVLVSVPTHATESPPEFMKRQTSTQGIIIGKCTFRVHARCICHAWRCSSDRGLHFWFGFDMVSVCLRSLRPVSVKAELDVAKLQQCIGACSSSAKRGTHFQNV